MKNTNYPKCFHTELKLLRLLVVTGGAGGVPGKGVIFPSYSSAHDPLFAQSISAGSASTLTSLPRLPCPPLPLGQ